MRIEDLLAAGGVDRTDAELLLAFAAGRNRAWVVAHAADDADPALAERFAAFAGRRARGEPLAYITGEKEFRGLPFSVRPGVLVPRPCTEALVDATLRLLRGERVDPVTTIDAGIAMAANAWGEASDVRAIADIGTGSGCIAVSLARAADGFRCVATDISMVALETAQENAVRHGVVERLDFRKGRCLDVFDDLREPFLVVTNPPYVADETLLDPDVRAHEPATALLGGGSDGGDVLREIARQASAHPFCRGIVAECLTSQAEIVTTSGPRPT